MKQGDKFYDECDYEKALAAYRKALELDPESTEAMRSIALCYSFQKNYDRALEYARKARDMSNDACNSYVHAWILLHMDEYEESVAVLEEALKSDPEETPLLMLKASCLNELKWNSEALTIIDEVLKKYPEESYNWHLKGDILSDLGRYEEAVACFNKSLKVANPFEKGWYCKAVAEEKLGKVRNALLSYQMFLEDASEEEWKDDFEKARQRIKELAEKRE